MIALEQAGADDVAGQQVRRALDARERQAECARERPRQQCLADARHVLDERVAVGQQRDDKQAQRLVVDDDGPADDLAQAPTTSRLPSCSRRSTSPVSPMRPVGARCADYPSPLVTTTASLWRHSDFMKLWTGQTVSRAGLRRDAHGRAARRPARPGRRSVRDGALIIVSQSLAVLLVGFFAGAWVDRVRRRPVLIAADALRALLLFSIPAAYVAGVLRIEQLYVVVFLEGCLGVLFDAAYPAYVPSLIGVDRVVEGNSKLATSSSIAEIGGPGLAGGLVQFIGAPFAILRRRDLVRRLGDLAAA